MFDFLTKKKINSAFQNNNRKHTLKNIENIRNVLILFSYNDLTEINLIASDLEKKGIKVTLWTLQSHQKSDIDLKIPLNVRIIKRNEISFTQILSTSVIDEFKALVYDTLIDLTTTSDKENVFKYLLAQNTSDFCIGISEPDLKFYDFIFLKGNDKTLQETYDQIKFYLSNVR